MSLQEKMFIVTRVRWSLLAAKHAISRYRFRIVRARYAPRKSALFHLAPRLLSALLFKQHFRDAMHFRAPSLCGQERLR